MSSTTLQDLLTILIKGSKTSSFISTLPENDLLSNAALYTQLGLKPEPVSSKDTQTIFEFRYQDHLQLENLLQSAAADIFIFWAPTTETQKKLYHMIMHSLWQILEQHRFKHVFCYYPNDLDCTLGLTEKCLANQPLLIAIQDDLFTRVQYDLVSYLLNNQKDLLKKHIAPISIEDQMDNLLNTSLDRYRILRLHLDNALHKIKTGLALKKTTQVQEGTITIEQKLDDLFHFFHFSAQKKYSRPLSSTLPRSIRQNELLRKMKRFVLKQLRRCKAFFLPKLGQLYHYPGKPFLQKKMTPSVLDQAHAPRISIVTPSFNQGSYIERTIKSVLDQNYPNLEYVIQDGLSSDNTADIIRKYEDKLTHWESVKDNGQSQAINLGFAHCSGEIMAYLNSDDLLLPGSLDYVARYFMQHPDVDVVYGHRVLIDENDLDIGRWVLPQHNNAVLSWADYIPQETLFWRRSLWEKVGGIDESFKFAMDWDLILRFRDAGAKFKRLPKFIGAFRIHPSQKTSAVINETGVQEMTRLRYRSLQYNPSQAKIHKHIFPYLLKHVFYHNLYALGISHYD